MYRGVVASVRKKCFDPAEPVPSSDFRQTDSRAHDKIYILSLGGI
jgi:hypothetical protein